MKSTTRAHLMIFLGVAWLLIGATTQACAAEQSDERVGMQCACGNWQAISPDGPFVSLEMLQNDVTVRVSESSLLGAHRPDEEQFYYLSCGETVALSLPSETLSDHTVTLSSVMVCEPPSCQSTYTYDIQAPDHHYIVEDGRGNTAELEYDAVQPGMYTVVFKATCDGVTCPPCTVFVEFMVDKNPCEDPGCKVDQLLLNTGFDHASSSTYQPVVPDGYWNLIASPNQGLSVPTPAWVIAPHDAWDTLPDSKWISAYNYAGYNQNNKYNEFYSFERCFCTCEAATLSLELQAYVDNKAWFYLDDQLIAAQSVDTTTSFQDPPLVDVAEQVIVEPGRHCLRVDVRNWSGVAMGLNVVGTVTTSSGGALFLTPDCCTPTGTIIVRKIHDVNGNGKDDNSQANPNVEPGMATITIQVDDLLTGDVFTEMTDANGFAYFTDLPSSTYRVSELYTDFVQTIPGNQGAYEVVVGPGDVIQLVFGNYR